MPKHGKKHLAAQDLVKKNGRLKPREAIEKVKEVAFAKFDETVEIAVNLGVDPRRADQVVRGTVILPYGTGRELKVLALVEGMKISEAEEAGADYVGTEYIDQIKDGWLDFDVAIATPDMMKKVAPLGRILGPRGLMPNPKAGTITMDIARAVREAKAGKIEFRTDRTGNVHAPIGRVSFPTENISENLDALLTEVVRLKPAASKGRYVRSVTVTSTMGPGVAIDENLYR